MTEKKEIIEMDIPLKIGGSAVFKKTIMETDVVLFGSSTNDYSQIHLNEEYTKRTTYGIKIVHSILTFIIECTVSTRIQEQAKSPAPSAPYEYDKPRLANPVYFGDTLTCRYTVDRIEEETNKTYSKLEISNQKGEIVVSVIHILKFFPSEEK